MNNPFPTNARHARTRKFPGVKGRRPDLKERRSTEALERHDHYRNLTLAERIALLDAKFGAGVGAARERARLAKPLVCKVA